MKPILEYLSTKVAQTKIKATDKTIHQIVKSELDRLGHDADLNHIDVSEVTDMRKLFSCNSKNMYKSLYEKYSDLNPDISKWNVRNVINMSSMFEYCEKFNCNLSNWEVNNVTTMFRMFFLCKEFNQDLSRWNVRKVKDHNAMFYECPIKEEYMPKFKFNI